MATAQIDDPLDAVAVHMGSGFWGLIACPLFLYDKGIVYSGSLESLEILAWNMAGAGAFIGWQTVCGILTFGFLKVRKYSQGSKNKSVSDKILIRPSDSFVWTQLMRSKVLTLSNTQSQLIQLVKVLEHEYE